MRLGRLGGVGAVLGVALVLSGCVVKTGVTAIAIRDGNVVGLVRTCWQVTVDRAALYGQGQDSLDYWEFDPTTSIDLELGSVDAVSLLAPGKEELQLYANASSGDSGSVRFTAAQLAGLEEGDVLMQEGILITNTRILSEDEFVTFVHDQCD